jgi:threonine aldolase
MKARYDFASDNTAGAAPEAVESWLAANTGFVSGYGTDPVVARAADLIRERLQADAEVRFLASGTAANALALAMLAQPHEAVLAHEHAHVCTDETGAPGFFGAGVGLIPLAGPSGKIEPAVLELALALPDVSYRQAPAALSLTQATEFGQVYAETELRRLIEPVKAAGLRVHLDGARLANAAAAGFDLAAISRLGVDALVMGGTKAGLPLSEALVIFDHSLTRRLDARLKHAGQLVSKARFLAAPWIGMLVSGAWSERSAHANAMASQLAERIQARTPYRLTHPVQANAVFVDMPEADLLRLRERGWFVYRFLDGSVRFMCSWATTAEAVEEIAEVLAV